jgi:hypothetical protein
MGDANSLLVLAVLLAGGVLSGAVARSLRLPAVTGQILAGIVLGPGLHVLERGVVHGLGPITHFAPGHARHLHRARHSTSSSSRTTSGSTARGCSPRSSRARSSTRPEAAEARRHRFDGEREIRGEEVESIVPDDGGTCEVPIPLSDLHGSHRR